jgi:hypothetical protein
MNWFDMAKNTQKWRAFVKAVMKSQFPKMSFYALLHLIRKDGRTL